MKNIYKKYKKARKENKELKNKVEALQKINQWFRMFKTTYFLVWGKPYNLKCNEYEETETFIVHFEGVDLVDANTGEVYGNLFDGFFNYNFCNVIAPTNIEIPKHGIYKEYTDDDMIF